MSGQEETQRFSLLAPGGAATARLDVWIAAALDAVSRSRAAALVRDGRVCVNGEVVRRPSRPVKAGDSVTVEIPPPEPLDAQPENLPLEIVYQDCWLAVVHKPAGMAVHPAAGTARGTLVNALLYHLSDLSGIGGKLRPGIVHRIDKTTSGLLVVAKDDATHRALAAQFKERVVEKEYRGFVSGTPDPPAGTIDQPIARHPRQRKLMAVVEGGRPARTGYEVLASWGHHSRLALRLFTGRTHQARVHCRWLGHPLVGDRAYGYRVAPAQRAVLGPLLERMPRVFLHAYRLAFAHPRTGRRMEWTAGEPADFAALAQALDRLR